VDREDARALLGLPDLYDPAAVEAAFRRQARSAHPDHGGDPERFMALVEGRRALLAPPPARRDGSVVSFDDHHFARRLLVRLWRLRSPRPPRVF